MEKAIEGLRKYIVENAQHLTYRQINNLESAIRTLVDLHYEVSKSKSSIVKKSR